MCFPINGLRDIVFNVNSCLPLCFALNVVYSDRQWLEECLEMESAVLFQPIVPKTQEQHQSGSFPLCRGEIPHVLAA